jgi:FlgN protein
LICSLCRAVEREIEEYAEGIRMNADWEAEIASLLNDLSAVQSEMLAFLGEKQRLLAAVDLSGMAALDEREPAMIERLQACHRRRGELLAQAAEAGRSAESLRALSGSLAGGETRHLKQQFRDSAQRARLLQHQSLTNWVIVQRTMLHLSQILEIIASGGRPEPTYGMDAAKSSGALVDQAA